LLRGRFESNCAANLSHGVVSAASLLAPTSGFERAPASRSGKLKAPSEVEGRAAYKKAGHAADRDGPAACGVRV